MSETVVPGAFALKSEVNSGGGRTMLAANLDWYVSATGSNANPGTKALPFADPAYAYQLAQRTLDLGGQYTITCHLVGNFQNVAWNFAGGLTGAVMPNSFILQGGSVFGAPGGFAISAFNFAGVHCIGVTVVPGSGGFGFLAWGVCGSLLVESCSGQTNNAHAMFDSAGTGCSIKIDTFTLVQTAAGVNINYLAVAEDQANIVMVGHWSFIGGCTFSTACVQADLGGMIDATGMTWTSTGGVGGVRFNALPPGIVFTGVGNSPPNFFPGSLPGNGANPWYQ